MRLSACTKRTRAMWKVKSQSGVRPELALNAGRAAREICVRTEPLRD